MNLSSRAANDALMLGLMLGLNRAGALSMAASSSIGGGACHNPASKSSHRGRQRSQRHGILAIMLLT